MDGASLEELAKQLQNPLADLVSVPFKWYPGTRVLTQAFLWRLLDLSESDGRAIELVIQILRAALPGLKRRAAQTPTPADDLIIGLLEHLAELQATGELAALLAGRPLAPAPSHVVPARADDERIFGFWKARLDGLSSPLDLATDPSDASGTLLYDVVDGCWSGPMTQWLGIDPGTLPPVVVMNDRLGRRAASLAGQPEVVLASPRIASRNTHGTGCTLSSAIAAHLALGLPLEDAVRAARAYILGAIQAGASVQVGHGHGPLNHGYAPLATRLL